MDTLTIVKSGKLLGFLAIFVYFCMKKVEIHVHLKREVYIDSEDENLIINKAKNEILSPKREINTYIKMLSNVVENHYIPLGDWEECDTYYSVK